MTPAEVAAENLLIWIDLALLYLIVFVLYRKYRVDALRHRLFVVRGELFDYALANGLAFNDPAYVMLRDSINSMLRFAHKISATRFLVLSTAVRWFSCTEMVTARERQWQEALARVAVPEQRRKIVELHEQALLAIVRHTTLGSILWALPLANVPLLSHLRQRYKRFLVEGAQMMELGATRIDGPPVVA